MREEGWMRTTIELSDDQRSVLHFLAAQRRLRGYSKLIEEAIDFYIKERVRKEKTLKHLLKTRSVWTKEEAKKLRKKAGEIRG
jgi:predicted transcriptional regulator